jgi:hypothetical protein
MTGVEFAFGGGALALVGGLVTMYRTLKDGRVSDRASVQEWNVRLEEKVNKLMENNDLLITEIHELRTRVLTLELFIRK